MIGQNRNRGIIIVVLDSIIEEEFLIESGRDLHLVCGASAIEIIHRLPHKVEVDSMAHLMGYCGFVIDQPVIVQEHECRTLECT